MKVNAKLWEAIREKNLTQKDFAALVGDNPTAVSQIITGVRVPDELRKIKYARALGVPKETLFGEE